VGYEIEGKVGSIGRGEWFYVCWVDLDAEWPACWGGKSVSYIAFVSIPLFSRRSNG